MRLQGSIYKYVLKMEDQQFIELHKNAEILSVGLQNRNICIWATAPEPYSEENNLEKRSILIRGTGHPCNFLAKAFIGTVIMDQLGLVYHIFEEA